MTPEDPDEDPGYDPAAARGAIILLAVLVEGGLIVLAYGLGWLLKQPPLIALQWKAIDVLWGVLATVPMIGVFLLMLVVPLPALARVRRFTDEILRPLFSPCTVIDLFGISVLAGVGEELLFRGVFQGFFDRVLPAYGHWPAVVLASALFGLLHAITPTYALFAAVMGAYLGWLWILTDNLLTPMVAHGLYDFLVLLYLLRGPGAREPLPDEESTEAAGKVEEPEEEPRSQD